MSLVECHALLFQAANDNSVSLLEIARDTYYTTDSELLAGHYASVASHY